MRAVSRALGRRVACGVVAAGLVVSAVVGAGRLQTPSTFAARIAQLSEPGGYFNTDNLISNERSYLHVIPALRDAGIAGGVYVGVGPDQNFSYIAQIRPSSAFLIDIRRDNLLLHLLFKALFQLAETRVEYVSLLFGRAPPAAAPEWRQAPVERLAAYVDGVSESPEGIAKLRTRVDQTIRRFGVPLSASDLATIDRFHRRFIAAGLSLQFETTGRAPQSYYPTYRDLLLETDRQGQRWSFLASEDDFRFVRSLQARDLIIPVVGDLGGPTALANIGRYMAEHGDHLAAFYASNVEFYLFGDGTFGKFIDNLSHLPHTSHSLMIRSVFVGRWGAMAPQVPGYASASLVQPVEQLLNGYSQGRFRDYWELASLR